MVALAPAPELLMTIAPLPPAADPVRLTTVLREAGVLGDRAVSDVAVISARDTVVSHIVRLGLSLDGAAPDAPRTLILKLPHEKFAEVLWQGGRHEVGFYRDVAPLMPQRLVPRCYDGGADEDTHTWHLLLEDLTDSHQTATAWPVPPPLPQAKAIVRALARLHAAWWDDVRLGQSVGSFASRDETAAHGEVFVGHYRRFADDLGDRLGAERRAVYDRFIAAMPGLRERYHSRRDLSLVHGDAHIWNFLVPRDADSDDVRPFDFDHWHIGVPANDLAYMIAMHLHPERRRDIEGPLLDCYHEALTSHGVAGYDRAALARDYRRAVLWHISKPVWQWAIQIPPVIWWNNLERIFLAVDDLGCRDLLG
jgi:aminoglycoside phosphotransferase (APT) family kinase protein